MDRKIIQERINKFKAGRNAKGVWIPMELWADKTLATMEKLFLVEVDRLKGGSISEISTTHLSSFFGIPKELCYQILCSLKTKKLIDIELEKTGETV